MLELVESGLDVVPTVFTPEEEEALALMPMFSLMSSIADSEASTSLPLSTNEFSVAPT